MSDLFFIFVNTIASQDLRIDENQAASLDNTAEYKATAVIMKSALTHLRKQHCDWCGGYGHRNGACGLRKRLLLRAGMCATSKAMCEAFL